MFLKGHGWSENVAEDVLKVAGHEYDVQKLKDAPGELSSRIFLQILSE